MIVTDIRELDKKRSKIYLDGDFAFVLYKGEIREYKIAVGQEMSPNAYDEVMTIVLPKRAKLRAMNLLQKKDYTEKQLRDKLSDGEYPQEFIDDAIAYVKSFNYIDDERYARDYISYHMATRSRNRIIQDLTGKGISKDVYQDILEELYQDDEGAEIEQIKKLLVKKHYDPDMTEYEDRQKIMAFLMRKGYNSSDIRRAMGNM
ncbi:MAG: regulatory protein RecX [Butyrivibrio sp.]|nr:regulatory protein RecX [Butyrivibrio sp.]